MTSSVSIRQKRKGKGAQTIHYSVRGHSKLMKRRISFRSGISYNSIKGGTKGLSSHNMVSTQTF